MPVSAAICGPDGCPVTSRTPATSLDTASIAAATVDMATGAAPPAAVRYAALQATAASSSVSVVVVRSAWPLQPPVPEPERCPAIDTSGHSAVAVRHSVQVLDIGGRSTASSVRPAGAVVREPVIGLAAAVWVQPAPVDASAPGGQEAAELATDRGHRRAIRRRPSTLFFSSLAVSSVAQSTSSLDTGVV
jgi:hypothetical protein